MDLLYLPAFGQGATNECERDKRHVATASMQHMDEKLHRLATSKLEDKMTPAKQQPANRTAALVNCDVTQ